MEREAYYWPCDYCQVLYLLIGLQAPPGSVLQPFCWVNAVPVFEFGAIFHSQRSCNQRNYWGRRLNKSDGWLNDFWWFNVGLVLLQGPIYFHLLFRVAAWSLTSKKKQNNAALFRLPLLVFLPSSFTWFKLAVNWHLIVDSLRLIVGNLFLFSLQVIGIAEE